MKVEVKRKSGEITLRITIPAKRVRDVFDEVKKSALKEVVVPGFRKGKVPPAIAEKHLSEDALAEALFNQIVPSAYAEALKNENIRPVVLPQLKIVSFRKDQDLVFEARTAESPAVKLGNYKAALKELKGKIIYGPDGKPLKGGAQITAGQVLDKLREIVNIEVPTIMIDQETQRMLSSLLEQAQTLGITIEQYLAAEGKTIDRLKEEYRQTAERNIKDELIISEVAREEKIEASSEEVEAAIAAAPDEKARNAFNEDAGRRYIGDVLMKRKTIEHLLRIAEDK